MPSRPVLAVLLVALVFVALVAAPARLPAGGLASPVASPPGSPAASPFTSPALTGVVGVAATVAHRQAPALAATIVAQATQLAQATTAVAAARATVTALSTADAGREAALATAQTQATAAQVTAVAAATQAARVKSGTTTRLNPRATQVSIQVDAAGVLAADPTALAGARRELHRVLDPYRAESCGVAVALTFGHETDIAGGTQLAQAINRLVATEFPDLVHRAVFVSFADLDPPLGQVDLWLYAFTGCPAVGSS